MSSEPKIEIVGKDELKAVGNALYHKLKHSESDKEKDIRIILLITRIHEQLSVFE